MKKLKHLAGLGLALVSTLAFAASVIWIWTTLNVENLTAMQIDTMISAEVDRQGLNPKEGDEAVIANFDSGRAIGAKLTKDGWAKTGNIVFASNGGGGSGSSGACSNSPGRVTARERPVTGTACSTSGCTTTTIWVFDGFESSGDGSIGGGCGFM
jgi:hypothetical protein